MKNSLFKLILVSLFVFQSGVASAESYVVDTKGAHAFIQFRIKHLGYSWLYGGFNSFSGNFSFDEKNPDQAKIEISINTNSIDTNHAERDKHLRGEDFLDVAKFPTATFVSSTFKPTDNGGKLSGKLTLHGVTKDIEIDVVHIGHGDDPWGGYRRGFSGSTTFKLSDFGIDYDLGPASQEIEMILSIEGVRQ